jgi:hypothetical protein
MIFHLCAQGMCEDPTDAANCKFKPSVFSEASSVSVMYYEFLPNVGLKYIPLILLMR